MADNTQQTTQQPTGQAATTVPTELLTAQTTSDPLAVPAEQMPGRKLEKEAAKAAVKNQQIGKGDTVIVSTRRNPAGEVLTASMASRFGVNSIYNNVVSATVKTTKLVDAKGNISRDQYNRADAYQELRKLNITQRISLLKDLYSRGMFPGKQGPSPTGLDDSSVSAMEQFLGIVNTTGYTWDVAKPVVMSQYPNVYGAPNMGGGQTYTVSNPKDIERVADQVAEQIIGRRISAADMQKIVQTVQGRERAAGLQQSGEIVSAPSAQTIAQEQIEKNYAQDAQLMRAASAMQFTEQLMRSI